MTLQEKETLKILAAVFLVMLEPQAVWLGLWIAGGMLLTVHFFKITQSLFPKKIFRFAILLWAAVFFQVSLVLTGILHHPESSFWFFSFLILLDWREFETKTLAPYPFPLLLRLGLFEGSLLVLSAVRAIWPQVPVIGLLPALFAIFAVSGNIQALAVRQSFKKKRPV